MEIMNYKKIIISLIGFCIMFYSCEDWLDREPLDVVSETSFFKSPGDFTVYVNRFHTLQGDWSTSEALFDGGTDIQLSTNSMPTRIAGQSTINSGPGYSYGNVRSANYVIERAREYKGDFNGIKQAVGEAHYFRAYFYFVLLSNFGDVQWIDDVLTMDSKELYGTRDPRNLIADKIIADLDTAAMYCMAEKGNGYSRITKWESLLLQSRYALYEGTWEKYHAGTVFGAKTSDPNKYLTKAASAAKQIIDSKLYSIWTTGDTTSDFYYNFNWRDFSTHPEIMRWSKMDNDLEISSHRYLYIQAFMNGYGPTKYLVDQFLCKDGLPISISPLYKGDNTIEDETINRDPRFDQFIFNKDDIWQVYENGDSLFYDHVFKEYVFRNVLNSNASGYQVRKRYLELYIYHDSQYEESPVPHYRYAEALLNYAEAKAELGNITQEDLDVSVNKLRDRVGMPHLMLANVPDDPDKTYPELSPLINEVRRERVVELAGEGFRWNDLCRWAAMSKIVNTRPKGAKDGQFFWPHNLAVDENGYLDIYRTIYPTGYQFKLNRDYLWPIPESQLTLNPNLGQNPGW
jgi:hypothetical protein